MGDIAVTKPLHNTHALLATEAAAMLVELARVPAEHREQFMNEAAAAVRHLLRCRSWRSARAATEHLDAKDFAELERGLRIAHGAYGRLTAIQTELLDNILARDLTTWADTLYSMLIACTALTGSSLSIKPAQGRGRRKNDVSDPLFQDLVRRIAEVVRANGGHLTLDAKAKRGTWVEALNALRSKLPVGVIKQILPLSTIERLVAAVNREPLDLLLMRLRF
jgi:hypothetical protein